MFIAIVSFIVFSALSLLSDLMGRAARNLYNELIGETPGHRLVTGNLNTPVNYVYCDCLLSLPQLYIYERVSCCFHTRYNNNILS